MSWYIDRSLIVDTSHLVAARVLDGTEAYDGMYMLFCYLTDQPSLRELGAIYATKEARDAAFAALGNLLAPSQKKEYFHGT